MQAYMDYTAGALTDKSYDEADLSLALSGLPTV
jgi:tryptophan synthase beta chain